MALPQIGFNIDHTNTYLSIFNLLMMGLLFGLSIYLELQWCFVGPIVVLESQWGYVPLKRSSNLVKGVRGVAFLMMMMLFEIPSSVLSIWCHNLMAMEGGWVVVLMVVYAVLYTLLLLFNHVANVLLFIRTDQIRRVLD